MARFSFIMIIFPSLFKHFSYVIYPIVNKANAKGTTKFSIINFKIKKNAYTFAPQNKLKNDHIN
ncbi:hypothetical protein JCM30204_04170 [Dysgonomonas termitidis]|jgi:hypothetical protein